MDDQHGILVDALNELHLAVTRGNGRAQIRALLGGILNFIALHVSSEEGLMERSRFPGLIEHQLEHERQLARLRRAAHQLECGIGLALGSLFGFLREDFSDHMRGPDQQYGLWLNERGIR